jgi:hypothetical protein
VFLWGLVEQIQVQSHLDKIMDKTLLFQYTLQLVVDKVVKIMLFLADLVAEEVLVAMLQLEMFKGLALLVKEMMVVQDQHQIAGREAAVEVQEPQGQRLELVEWGCKLP